MTSSTAIQHLLHDILREPLLANARRLEGGLESEKYQQQVFGRLNQKASIDAASESDRGIAERLSNAFDASLTAARLRSGVAHSDPTLTPRIAAQRFLCPEEADCAWTPQWSGDGFEKPSIEFWQEADTAHVRFRKYNPGDGLATVLVSDHGCGITRDRMSKTILDLNTDDKLRTFEAIGQFGHGGSSALAFCESCLVITQPRFADQYDEFYWTLIVSVRDENSKQPLVRKWFSAADGKPLVGRVADFPELHGMLPGTAVWHFGYNRGEWIKKISGPEQTNPWGRLGRLFFSYPLPFEVKGQLARADSPSARRTIKGAFYRLRDRQDDTTRVEYCSEEKSETLIIENEEYGQFSVFTFVLRNRKDVRGYVDPEHPIILTLNGQNHGELTDNVLVNANLPELSTSMIVEIRVDRLDREAVGEIINNSREYPKNTAFSRALKERVSSLLENDEMLQELEAKRQEAKARHSSAELNDKITRYLASITSDALGEPANRGGGSAPGRAGTGTGSPRPEIPAADPPTILQFVSTEPIYVPEGSAVLAKFMSDARPPRYSFHGDNPRVFAELAPCGLMANRLVVSGKGDINDRGYGSVTLTCGIDHDVPIVEAAIAAVLTIRIQVTNGQTLLAKIDIGVKPRPPKDEKRRRPAVRTVIVFSAPATSDRAVLEALLAEKMVDPGDNLEGYCERLGIGAEEAAYWGEKSAKDGVNYLTVEINAAHPRLGRLLEGCSTTEDRVRAKERFVQDVVLDCYQHSYRIEDLPPSACDSISQDNDELRRDSEMCLNHDKALRMAMHDRDSGRSHGA